MPAKTYEPIANFTVSSAQASYTFSSIPATYTDLVMVIGGIPSTTTVGQTIRVNGDTGSNYSTTLINGNGSTAVSARYTNNTGWEGMNYQAALSPIYNTITSFFNYANTSVNKTALTRYNGANVELSASANLWRNTAAITSITALIPSGTYAAGSTFTLYGIKAA
jgi:hypothetical protein